MDQGEALEQTFPLGRDLNQDLAPIDSARRPAHKAPSLQPVDQLDRAVMAKQEALREISDRGGSTGGNAPQGQQELVLRGIDPRLARRAFAETEKTPDLVAKLRERPVVVL
jgi:hypothetical protein